MDTISRVSSLLEPTRDLTLEASAVSSSLRRPNTTATQTSSSLLQIKKLLESRHDREVLDGLKRLLGLSYSPHTISSRDAASQLLPTVLKNIASPNTYIRRLVYAILVTYAESDQDTALLSINSIQKGLSASDPYLRALALRTISSLRVPVIAQIVALGIKRGAGDMSAVVRRTAALAIPKCWKLDSTTAPQLEQYLEQLLGDKQYVVAGAACIAIRETGMLGSEQGRERVVRMLHRHYRGLCRKLVDMDEWGQIAAIKVLTVYARRCFPRKTRRMKKGSKLNDDEQGLKIFYNESEMGTTAGKYEGADEYEIVAVEDTDLSLLLKSALPLLQSRNPAVIIAVTRLYLALTPESPSNLSNVEPPTYLTSAIPALLTLLRPTATPSTAPIALHNLLQLALRYPSHFVSWTRHFLLKSTDSPTDTGPLKLEALVLIFPYAPAHTQSLIIAELAAAARRQTNTASSLVKAAISGLGRCAMYSAVNSTVSQRCLNLLLEHVKTSPANSNSWTNDAAASEALTQIRHLIQSDPNAHIVTVIQLAKDLDTTTQPKARAAIVWLVGEYSGVDMSSAVTKTSMLADEVGNVAADVLRILARGFADEAEEVKTQIVLLAAKCYIHYLNSLRSPASKEDPTELTTNANLDASTTDVREEHPIPLLYAYIHSLIRYDTSYTLRDTARLHRSLLPPPPLSTFPNLSATSSSAVSAANTQLATLLLLAPKPPPVTPSPAATRKNLELGSAALVLGDRSVAGYEVSELPDRVEDGAEPDPRLRDEDGVEGPHRLSAPVAERLDVSGGDNRELAPRPKEKTLEDWLDESDEDEDADESDSGEDESSEEESEEESEEDNESEHDRLVR